MIAFAQFIFVIMGFSVLFHFIDLTDQTTMRGYRPKIGAVMALEIVIMIWAGWLLWGDA